MFAVAIARLIAWVYVRAELEQDLDDGWVCETEGLLGI